MNRPLHDLALYLTGPCVGLHSAGLEIPGAHRVNARAFFAMREAFGVTGYMTTDEAYAAITRAVGEAK